MRVSDSMTVRNFLRNLGEVRERVFEKNAEVSSGKKLTRPSDDPAGSARILRIREQMSRINQYHRNVNHSRVMLASTSDALNSLRNMVNVISQKASSGLNGTLSQSSRDAIAAELDVMLQEIVRTSSTTVDGKKIFSGSNVLTDPLAQSGGTYVYQGDTRIRSVEIAEDLKVQINIPGSDIFTETNSDLVNTVAQLANALRASDLDGARQLMTKLNSAGSAIDTARTKVGGSMNQLDTARTRLEEETLALTQEASSIEDADLAESITQLTQNETALKAALSIGARLRQSTLFDIFG